MAFVRKRESGDGARHARGFVAHERCVFDNVSARVEVHVARRGERRALAVIDRFFGAVRVAQQHESATAEVAGFGPGDGEGERDSNRSIDRVASPLHDVSADA